MVDPTHQTVIAALWRRLRAKQARLRAVFIDARHRMVVASLAKLRLGFLILKLKTLYYLKALFHDPFRWHGLIPPERVMCSNSNSGSGAGLRRRCGLANHHRSLARCPAAEHSSFDMSVSRCG
jgi:hypothetical protein